MKVAIVTEWFSEGMGYAENALPSALSRQGHEAHVFTSDLQVYGNSSMYSRTYLNLLGDPVQRLGASRVNGFDVHRLRRTTKQKFRLEGLESELDKGGFELVYGFEINQELSRQLLEYRAKRDNLLFLESRLHASIFQRERPFRPKRIAQIARHRRQGKTIVRHCDRIFPIANDVHKILRSEFGIPDSMMQVQGLGVDDSIFFADREDSKAMGFRQELRLRPEDRLLVYAGRLTRDKGVDLLVDAYVKVREHRSDIRLLLVGDGELSDDLDSEQNVNVMPFQRQTPLASIYRCADIGVWPKQESTSRYDAAACGLHLVVPQDVGDLDRLPAGTATFLPNSAEDLANVLSTTADRLVPWSKKPPLAGFQLDAELSWSAIASQIIRHAISHTVP